MQGASGAQQVVVLDAFDVRERGKGISRSLANIVPRLVARSDADRSYVVLTTAEGARVLSDVEAERVRIVPQVRGSVWEQICLPWFARSVRADLVYVLREVAPLIGVPYILHIPEDPEIRWEREPPIALLERARATYQRMLMRRSLARASALLAISASTAARMETRYGLRDGSILPVPLGVESRFLDAPSRPRVDYVFHLGSGDPRDNSIDVVRAYVQLARGISDPPELVMAGDLGQLRTSVEEAAAGSDGRIRFLGRVSDEDLASLYAGAIVCVQPASDEGFGLQPLEAMATGAVVLVLDTPAVREVVGSGALLVPSADPPALATAMGRVLREEEDRKRLQVEARERARMFSWERTVDAIEHQIDACLGAP